MRSKHFSIQQRSPKYSRPVFEMRERRTGWKAHSDFTLFWTWSTVLFHSWFVHASRDSSRWTTDWNTSIRIQWRVAMGHTFNFPTFSDRDLGAEMIRVGEMMIEKEQKGKLAYYIILSDCQLYAYHSQRLVPISLWSAISVERMECKGSVPMWCFHRLLRFWIQDLTSVRVISTSSPLLLV